MNYSELQSGSFLMTVIRTLSTSESNEERDKEKAKLEKDYHICDKELDELISQHDQDLAQVMQVGFYRCRILFVSIRIVLTILMVFCVS